MEKDVKYAAPFVEVIEVEVEKGFSVTGGDTAGGSGYVDGGDE